jgi:Pectate lyase
MLKTIVILSLFPNIVIAGGASRPDQISWPDLQKELPPEPSCKKYTSKTIEVDGVFDGKGCIYFWTGKGKDTCHGDEEVSENEPRMFVMKPGSTLKNVVIDCSPDGILMNDNTTIDNVFIRDVGEDGVTTNGVNNTIKNSKFYRCDDKCTQNNFAKNVRYLNNEFHYGKIPLGGSGATRGGARPIYVIGNKFKNVKTVILSQRNHIFEMGNNSAENIECFFETKEQGVIHLNGSKQTIKNGELMCSRGTKNVK